MHFLYGCKAGADPKLVATFDSEPLLLSYVRWATLTVNAGGEKKFEQGSSLVGFTDYQHSTQALTGEDPAEVVHNPSPSML